MSKNYLTEKKITKSTEITDGEAQRERIIIRYLKDLNDQNIFPTKEEIYKEAFGVEKEDPEAKKINKTLLGMYKRKQIKKEDNVYKLNGVFKKMNLNEVDDDE